MNEAVYSHKKIQIFLDQRELQFSNGQEIRQVYPIAVGKPSTPTPTGVYDVVTKIVNPGGMLGTRWLGLSIPNGPYGIHGTTQPELIGQAVSHGCIRMYNQDVEALFTQVHVGTTVEIIQFRA